MGIMKKHAILLLLAYSSVYFLIGQGVDMRVDAARHYQKKLNSEYADPVTSPLEKADLENFSSLIFFPINLDFYVTATFKRSRGERTFKMKTSTDRLPEYKKFGVVSFELKGTKYTLSVYQNIELSKTKEHKNYLFLPFTDLTNGETTYGGGRYIDLEISKKRTIVIDFNQAYN